MHLNFNFRCSIVENLVFDEFSSEMILQKRFVQYLAVWFSLTRMRNENEQKGKKNCYSLTITKMRKEKFKQNNNEI